MTLPGRPGWLRIAVLYFLGLASLSCAVIGAAMAWEAITWHPADVGELPPMLLQFCIGGAAATASGLLAISCLVPAVLFHTERRLSPHLPSARVVPRSKVEQVLAVFHAPGHPRRENS